ncbi:MauE/DoxX family redox-associated membrane protein [Sphingobacterium humi]|uniref:Methylamine utilisation protein MauE domain-containing protein n=1 Tax=Sphingobacterium humi TaxID=1796905 RepID=A0A6N8L3U9_9SPHI|nr:MauE/DoxX family redox-associated membrane protein [Sphingobacterium humi]MVZ63764.1 hypothetical protein [Sphingobacterium humi]
MRTRNILVEVIAALLIAMFAYASFMQLLHHHVFTGDINNQVFPNSTTPYLVWLIPMMGLLTAALLISKRTRKAGFYMSAGLLTIYTGYIILVLMKAFRYTPCSCAGVVEGFTWWEHFYFNLAFLVLSFAGIGLQRKISNDNKQPDWNYDNAIHKNITRV